MYITLGLVWCGVVCGLQHLKVSDIAMVVARVLEHATFVIH
jgi:hypothetical protein